MASHPHASAGQGEYNDNTARTDVTGDVSSVIGQAFAAFGHFAAPIHHAPIHGMTTRHHVVIHKSCNTRILHAGYGVNFMCAGCGEQVVDLSELTAPLQQP